MAGMPDPRNPYEFTREAYNELLQSMPEQRMSARSAYEEIELVEDCTLYDIYRQPRAPVTDPSVVRTLSVRTLNPDLTCPICLDIIRNTKVVMECLHRFCGECIEKCLRVGKNECPSCRIHIPSKRSLRSDTTFDQLIAAIYPDLDAFQRDEERLVADINLARHCNNALTKSTELGVLNQKIARRNAKKRSSAEPATSQSASSASSAASASDSSPSQSPVDEHMGPSWSGAAATNALESARKKPRSAASSTSETTARDGSTGMAAPAAGARASPPSAPTQSATTAPLATNGSASVRGNAAPASTQASTPASSTPSPASATAAAPTAPPVLPEDTVNIRVLLHPEDKPIPTYKPLLLRTSAKLRIRYLKRHLCKNQLQGAPLQDMRILLAASNFTHSGLQARVQASGKPNPRRDLEFDQELDDELSLADLFKQYDMGTHWELQVLFHFSDAIVAGVARFLANANEV